MLAEHPSVRVRRRIIILAVLALGLSVVIAAIITIYLMKRKTGITIEQAQAIADGVPIRSNRAVVEKYLDAQRIRHDYYPGGDGTTIGDRSIESIAGVNSSDVSGTLRATIDDADVHLLYNGNIQLFFFFGKDGRLIRAHAHSFVHYP